MVVPREAVVEALRQVRQQVRWRPGESATPSCETGRLRAPARAGDGGHVRGPDPGGGADPHRRGLAAPLGHGGVSDRSERGRGRSVAGDARDRWGDGDGVSTGGSPHLSRGSPVYTLGNNGGACGMNPLLAHYGVAVHHPEVSAEHRTAADPGSTRRVGTLLTAEELEALGVADAHLGGAGPEGPAGTPTVRRLGGVSSRAHIPPGALVVVLDVIQHVPRPPSATPAGA